MTRAVHQFVSSFVPRDAVSRHAIEVQRLLHDAGFESEIYVKETRGEVLPLARYYREFTPTGDEVLVYQAATGSPLAEALMTWPGRKIVNYHNLTPPEFFAPWEPHTAVELRVGRRQIADLADHAELGLAVSAFNEADLRSLGYRRTAVAPFLLDPATLTKEIDESARRRLEGGRGAGPEILFVGRLAPNKAQHDLVKAFVAYRQLYEPDARLHLVGAPSSGRYQRALQGMVAALGLESAVDLAGSVTDGELAAHYATADLLVCLSEHEGFCVPVVEAMHHRLPIVAFAAGALPETVGDAGLLLCDKDPVVVATAIDRAWRDPALRTRLVEAGGARLAQFSLEAARARFLEVVDPWLAP